MDEKHSIVLETRDFLEREDFSVSLSDSKTTCFDLLARRRSFVLMIKILSNIDSITLELACDLKSLSTIFGACPLLIGRRTRSYELQDGVLHNRYGINTVTVKTFSDIICEELLPLVISSRGGYYVRVDGDMLKKKRVEDNISVGELSEKLGVSRAMIYSYENSGLGMTLSTVIRLEEFFDASLATPFEVFTVPVPEDYAVELPEDKKEAFSRLEEIGFEILPARRAPFDAVTRGGDVLMLSKVDKRPRRRIKEIRIIKEVSDVASCSAFLITESPDAMENCDGVPVVKRAELEKMESPGEFLEVLEDRR